MSKKNKIIRISLIVFFSLLLIVGLIIFIIHKKNENNKPTVIPSDEPEIPEIKEDFNTASFDELMKALPEDSELRKFSQTAYDVTEQLNKLAKDESVFALESDKKDNTDGN